MKKHIDAGDLVMIGVIQEQHADRCRLFRQWKNLDFPIVQDLLNSNGIAVVPVYVAIDENGIVRGRPRNPRTFAKEFLDVKFESVNASSPIDSKTTQPEFWEEQIGKSRSIGNLMGLADAMIQWNRTQKNVNQAEELYIEALKMDKKRSDVEFRLGATNRLLYELGDQSDPELFGKAVRHWETALRLNPNQYIYRRRIEQYGPRLKKPYSFYDWVETARSEIQERGDKPIALMVEPNGAEFAKRARKMIVDDGSVNPDPGDKIILDDGKLVQVHANFVPTNPKPGDVVAVHVGFSVTEKAKWNHETAPLKLWVQKPAGNIKLSSQLIEDEKPYNQSESQEPVSISFELQIPADQDGDIQLEAFGLFNICESEKGQCIFRRRNVTIHVPVKK